LTLIISHRGNIHGPDLINENRPAQIDLVISLGFECEIDLRYDNKELFLGHDKSDYQIDYKWLLDRSDYLWVHCKSFQTLNKLIAINSILQFFWHQSDDYALTSRGYLWTFPGCNLGEKSIAVLPEKDESKKNWNDESLKKSYGVCTDYPKIFKEKLI